jgi:predicted TIM-barrel fold metal-dependent hydrolase
MTSTGTVMNTELTAGDPLIVVSGDSHVGPLIEGLRAYCPRKYHAQFDDFMARHKVMLDETQRSVMRPEDQPRRAINSQTAGHYDMDVRLQDMDRDGVAAEVMFHGSQNNEPFPFQGSADFHFQPSTGDLELAAVGGHIYNRWLADACSTAPDRLLGCMALPMWDIVAAVKEMRWAREAGLRMVNFPAPKAGIHGYEDPAWEPFWIACEDLGVTLFTHSGSGEMLPMVPGPYALAIGAIEAGGWPVRRNMTRMIFGGVFERHPGLKLVLTEQNGEWWTHQVMEYDSAWYLTRSQVAELVPRMPHEYMHQNCFIGASFIAHFEVEAAIKEGYWENVIWGRDYPHVEGTFVYREDDHGETATHQHLRWAFAGTPAEQTKAVLGENAVRILDLERDRLADIARQIAAPTLEELSQPLEVIPDDAGSCAFRRIGPWG